MATLIAVYGLFMTPLGWGWAGFVWGYALLWFLLNDRIKLLAYRIFDRVKTKTPSELNQQIANRAYEIYEQKGRHEGHAVQDWAQAEKEVRKAAAKVNPTPRAMKENKTTPEPKPEIKQEAKPGEKQNI